MNTTSSQEPKPGWAVPTSAPARLSPEDLQRWHEVTAAVRAIAEREGLSKTEVANRSGVPMGTFSPWYDGKYTGVISRQTRLVERWVDSVEESARFTAGSMGPGFVRTRTADELIAICGYAQAMPAMAVVVLGPGLGKTFTARHYQQTRPHTTLITMRPTTANVRNMLTDLAGALGIPDRNPAKLDRLIGERLKRNGRQTLLIVDEVQNLVDSAINQLRFFLDEYECGLVLMGNEELYSRLGGPTPKPAYAQLHRRITRRLYRVRPLDGDVDAYVKAWRLPDPEAVELCRAIGKKPGALGQIAETLKLAHMLAAADEKPVSADYVRTAWEQRGEEAPRTNGARPAAVAA
jgi:DNA transposition AAA+ family ATPase